MKNNKKIILNVFIILISLGTIILDVIDGLVDKIGLIFPCLMILLSVIEICMEMKNKSKESEKWRVYNWIVHKTP